jgi:hypothetical protein
MPGAVVALAASWAGSYVATTIFGLAAGSLGAAVLGGVVAMGLSKVGQKLVGGVGGSASNVRSGGGGILINDAVTVTSIPIIYGARRVGGKRVFVGNSGEDNKFIHMAMVLSEGEIYGITDIYFNNVKIASASGVADGAIVTSYAAKIPDPQDPTQEKDNPYTSKTQIYVHYGTDAQTVDTNLQTAVGNTIWTNDHRLRGISYIYVRLEYDKDVFGGLPDITCDILGKKIRKYTTPTAFETAAATNGNANNPAWVLLDYLTNSRYGRGIDYADIDLQSFIDAADYCDDNITISGNTFNRFLVNGHLDPDSTLYSNIKDILASCAGFLVFTGGKYRLLIDKVVPVGEIDFEFTEDNIIGGISITLGSKTTRYNKIKINYFDPQKDWSPNISILEDATYRAEDDNQVLEREIELPLVSDFNRAQFIARLFLNQSRFGTAVTFTGAPSALVCSVGDVVYVSHPTPGWVRKPFRIISMSLKDSGEVDISAIEYADEMYSITTLPTQVTKRNYSNFSSSFFTPVASTVPAPTNLVVTNTPINGLPAMTVSFTAPSAADIIDYIIEYQENGNVQQQVTTSTTTLITGLKNQVTYTVRVYSRNSQGRISPALE